MKKILLAMLLIIPAIVSGLGVSPASQTIDYEPNATVELGMFVVNSEAVGLNVSLSAEGELKDYVYFESQVVEVRKDFYMNPFRIKFTMPEGLSPGYHGFKIKVAPIVSGQGGTFSAFVSPELPVIVRVPYPEKYAEVRFYPVPIKEGMPLSLYIEFDNLGNLPIDSAQATVRVHELSGRDVAVLATDAMQVPAFEMRKAEARPAPILRKGVYVAIVEAAYDETAVALKANFTVDEPRVRAEPASRRLYAGSINRVDLHLESDWNTPLVVSGSAKMGSVSGELPVTELEALETRTVPLFLDLTGVEIGEYNLTLTMAYAGSVREEQVFVRVVRPGVLYNSDGSLTALMVAIYVLLAIIAAIGAYLAFRPRKPQGGIPQTPQERELPETFK